MVNEFTSEQLTALDVARSLVTAGVPLFLAHPDVTNKTGFRPPPRWERSTPDPTVVDRWQPGLALCAVMGHGLDLLDFDPRNGGDPGALNGIAPRAYGVAATPSGGTHWFIASLGVGSRDNVLPGVDVKGGLPDGSSRGFAFLAPTVRASAVTGELVAYRWTHGPDLAGLNTQDDSGAALATRLRELRATSGVRQVGGPVWWCAFLLNRSAQWVEAAEQAVTDKLTEIRGWTKESGDGFRTTLLRASLTLGGYVGGGWLDEAEARRRLEEAVSTVWGTPDNDDHCWIQQGLDDGAIRPFPVYTTEDKLRFPDGSGDDDDESADPYLHLISNEVNSFHWLISEVGQRGLSGMFLRGHELAYCSRINEDGYIPPPQDPDNANDNGPATISGINPDGLVAQLALRYQLWKWVGGQKNPRLIEAFMPLAVCRTVLAAVHDALNVRRLRGVTHTPLVRRDGSIFESAGFDQNTGYLYLPAPDLEVSTVPEHPSTEELHTATAFLRNLIGEFAWAGEHDEANYLGLLLLPLLRELAPPPYKLAAIMARQPGSGKSLLARILRIVHGGVFRTEMPHDDAEISKSITAILTQTTAPIVTFDNITGILKSSRLAGLLTSAEYADRILGSTNHITVPNDRIWTITGNNLALGGDLVRRALWVTIDPRVPNPEQRTGFSIPDLPTHVTARRGEILWSLLVWVRAWIDAGAPAERNSSDDYAGSSATVRGILTIAGIPGEFDHVQSRQQDMATGDDDWQEFLSAIYATFGTQPWTVRELLGKIHDGRTSILPHGDYDTQHPIPFDTLPPELAEKLARQGTGVGKSLGRWLANREGRWADTLTVRRGKKTGHDKLTCWRVEPFEEPNQPTGAVPDCGGHGCGVCGICGVSPRPPYAKKIVDLVKKPLQTEEKKPRKPLKPRNRSPRADQDKAEQRQAAIRSAAGEVLALPAVVTRSRDDAGEQHVLPVTVGQAEAVIRAAVTRAGALTVDVETSGYPVGHADYALRSVQLGDEIAAVVLDPEDEAQRTLTRRLLVEAPRLHAHSATADLVPLAHAGLIDAAEAWTRMHDTVIPAKLADPQSTGSDPGLKRLAGSVLGDAAVAPVADAAREALFKAGKWITGKQRFADQLRTPVERNGWTQVQTGCATMLRYAASDVLDTAALARRLPSIPPAILDRERLAETMTARVTHRGLRIDAERVRELTAEHTARRDVAAARVRVHGIDNPGSGPQVAAALTALGVALPVSEKGNPSVAEHVLSVLKRTASDGQLAAASQLAAAVLDYRHSATALGLFLAPYALLCERADGRMRPTVYTLGTDTGRMSCVRPNAQQLPREGGIRSVVTADPGYVLISADFSGVELRGAAALSQDPTMMHMICEEDAGRFDGFHWAVARQAFGPNATKADRYMAKRGVFGHIYGGGVATLAKQVGVTEAEMGAVVSSLKQMTPGLAEWSEGVRRGVRSGETPYYMSYSGRVIWLPSAYSYKAPNYEIQGTCRELLVDALIRWRDTQWGEYTLLPVHDELIVMVPEAEAEAATAELVRCMQGELYGVVIKAKPSAPSFAWQDAA